MTRVPPKSTLTDTLFPSTTLFRSGEFSGRPALVTAAIRPRNLGTARRDDHRERQHARPADAAEEIGFVFRHGGAIWAWRRVCNWHSPQLDRKGVVEGKSVSVRVDLGGTRSIKKKKTKGTEWNDESRH